MDSTFSMHSPHPKKSFGQNFLTSIPARLKMVEGGEVCEGDTVLEIGPGKGFLTEALLQKGAQVIAVEKDRDLIPYLTEHFREELRTSKLRLIEEDILHFDPRAHGLKKSTYKLVANIPYYITGAILSQFLTSEEHPSSITVLVQKEVAERICARDGKKNIKHSLLSLSVHVYGTPSLIHRVNKGSFFPVPKVDSAILTIRDISKKNFASSAHEELFFKLIHAGFAHKRKYALSNLALHFNKEQLQKLFLEASVKETTRAEDVTLSQWLHISSSLVTQE
jgi:16S rRNA (adenine1518-N6/adenine1519-N6)-dimethyltransferase